MNNAELEKKISSIMLELSDKQGYVSSIDVLIKLNYMSQQDYEKWRNGKIEYLEKICQINLSKLTTINQIIKQKSKKLNFEPSLTVYNKIGKGNKQKLRFSKSGNENIEKAYSTHYINKYQINKLKELRNKNIQVIKQE